MALDKLRTGEIALIILLAIVREKGFRISDNLKREIQNRAKKLGIPEEEMFEFLRNEIEPTLHEMVVKAFTTPEKKKRSKKPGLNS